MSISFKNKFKCCIPTCNRIEIIETEIQTEAINAARILGWGINLGLKLCLCPECYSKLKKQRNEKIQIS